MDKKTYTQLLETHRDRVYSYLLYCLRDRDDAEDLTQEVFLRLWKHGRDFRIEKAEAWLIRVAHNLCVDHSRRSRTVRRHLGRPDESALERLADTETAWDDPERQLDRNRTRQEILQALGTLQTETRSIMLMHYFQGLRLQDIAKALGKKSSTVKVQVHRARKSLRLVLEAGSEPALATKRETG
jgi:RNA polymerase sigma-70 factor (ECF subfamily)